MQFKINHFPLTLVLPFFSELWQKINFGKADLHLLKSIRFTFRNLYFVLQYLYRKKFLENQEHAVNFWNFIPYWQPWQNV